MEQVLIDNVRTRFHRAIIEAEHKTYDKIDSTTDGKNEKFFWILH